MRWLYLQPPLEMLLFTVIVMTPHPFMTDEFPAAARLRYGNDLYLFLFLVAYAFSYAPRFVVWAGATAVVMWSAVVLWVAALPGSKTELDIPDWERLSLAEQLAAFSDPYRINLGFWAREMLILAVVAGGLAVLVARSRGLVLRQVSAERERANLSRYFSPRWVERLARSPASLDETRHQDVSVLFADLVGFTGMASKEAPDAVIALLREYHRRMARAVFAHDGTLDEYLGDGVMATFGTPESGERDATDALRCARAILAEIDAWNVERAQAGDPALRVRIGVHHGPVVLGNVGDAQLKLAVVGDTVNVASRLQELTRDADCAAAVSDAVVAAVRTEGAPEEIGDLVDLGEHALRGRDSGVRVWGLRT